MEACVRSAATGSTRLISLTFYPPPLPQLRFVTRGDNRGDKRRNARSPSDNCGALVEIDLHACDSWNPRQDAFDRVGAATARHARN
jgi:hypothetical protein